MYFPVFRFPRAARCRHQLAIGGTWRKVDAAARSTLGSSMHGTRWTGAILGSSLGSSWGVQGPYHTNPSLVPFRQWDRHRICHRIAMDHSFPRTVPPSDRNRNRRPPTTTTPHSASRIAPPPDHRRSPPANHRHSATSPALPTFFLPPAHLEREWVSTIFVRPDGDWGRERERRCLVCCCGA